MFLILKSEKRVAEETKRQHFVRQKETKRPETNDGFKNSKTLFLGKKLLEDVHHRLIFAPVSVCYLGGHGGGILGV